MTWPDFERLQVQVVVRGQDLVTGAARSTSVADALDVTFTAKQADVCVGWRTDGPVYVALEGLGHNAMPYGPDAPALEVGEEVGWHVLDPLSHGTVRRPGAVASAQVVVGVPLAELDPVVRARADGRDGCTHLTSILRSLADVAALGALAQQA